jgi:glutathione S-transferase
MKLYNNQSSGNCWKVRQILALLDIPYERVELDVIDRSNRAEVLGGKNPALRVPTLELDDGEHLAESNAILWYLADGTEYVPTEPLERARALQWMFFEQYEVEPNIAVARFWISILGQPDEHAAELEGKRRGGTRALDAIEGHLAANEWLVGGAFSVADISVYAYTHVAEEGGFDLAPHPATRAWIERVAGRPGYIPMEA